LGWPWACRSAWRLQWPSASVSPSGYSSGSESASLWVCPSACASASACSLGYSSAYPWGSPLA
jgi:hypothetical protein